MWKRILKTAHRLGFTRNETLVLLFLLAVITAGSVLTELRPTDAMGNIDVRQAYRTADTVFAHRSAGDVELIQTELRETEAPSDDPIAVAAPNAINVNTATERELTRLPGIGPATAQKILEHRKTHGPFNTVDDLIQVKSIGTKKLQRIRQFITVE